MQTVGVLLVPALPGPVPSLKVAEGAVGDDDARADFLTFTAPFDYSGHPTLSLPAGLESQSTRGQARLPRAVQLVGPLLGESLLIQIGSSLEHALGQHFGSLFTTGAYPGGGAG